MPPKKTTDAAAGSGNAVSFTDSEVKLINAIMETIPRSALNYDALAEKLGSASVNAARMRVTAAVGKYNTWFTANTAQEGGAATPKPRAKRTPKKKAPSDEDDNEANEQETPSKKKARTAKPKAKAAAQKDDGDQAGGQAEDPGEV